MQYTIREQYSTQNPVRSNMTATSKRMATMEMVVDRFSTICSNESEWNKYKFISFMIGLLEKSQPNGFHCQMIWETHGMQ